MKTIKNNIIAHIHDYFITAIIILGFIIYGFCMKIFLDSIELNQLGYTITLIFAFIVSLIVTYVGYWVFRKC
ncbi:MAG: hypothetical protein ACOVOW_04100 [Spirosomataceae bacterium]|nr:hypothetical protein [Flectobacillus sp.]